MASSRGSKRVSRGSAPRKDRARSRSDPTTIDVGNGDLLAAAAKLFRQAGYSGATTRVLAGALGVRSASLYYHMGKKEDLLYEICVDTLRRMIAAVGEGIELEGDPNARLRSLIRIHMRTALSDSDKHVTMLIELRSLSPRRRARVLDLRDEYEDLVLTEVRRGQRRGAIRADIAPRLLTLALLNLLNWSIFWYRPGGALSPEGLADLFGRIFLEGSAPRRLSTPAPTAARR